MELLNERFPLISENILLELKVKELVTSSLTCKAWFHILEKPSFWLKKGAKIGMPSEFVNQWKSIFRAITYEGDIKHILGLLKKKVFQGEAEGKFESMVSSVLCQEKISDIKLALQFLGKNHFESMKEEFEIISTFEDYVWPTSVHHGIEIEACA